MRAHPLHTLSFVLGVWLLGSRAAASCDDPFADPNAILELHLETTTAAWAELRDSELTGEGCDAQYPYYEASFRCGDEPSFIPIGIRKKRDRTGSDFKPPIKLDFNRMAQGQRWPAARGEHGFRKLSLNSGQPDDAASRRNAAGSAEGVLSAMITEHLSWRLMREEVPESSGVAYAKLTLHFSDTGQEQYQGLYILIEDIDRTAVRSRFGVDNGALWKTTSPDCPEELVFDDGLPNSATEAFDAWLALQPSSFEGTWYQRTDEAVHLDMLLRQEALRELLVNTADSVLGRMNNYFALDLFGDRRRYLPWDLDDMFRPQPQIHAPETPLVSSCVGRGGTCAPLPVGVNIRDNAEIRVRYLETLCNVINGTGNENKILAEFAATDQRIRPILAEEVPILWEPLGLDPLDASTPGTYAAELDRMQTWVPARVDAVRELVAAEGVACAAGCEPGATLECEAFGTTTERACIDGIWGPCQRPPGPAGTGGTGGGSAAGGVGNPPAAGTAGGAIVQPPSAGASGSGPGAAGNMNAPVGPDAGAPNGGSSAGGCACQVGRAPNPVHSLLLFALGFLLIGRRLLATTCRR